MHADLDPLMTARGIGALIVPMHEAMHASFRWITRGAKVTRGYAIKVAGREPLLVTYPMERDEGAATGLETLIVHKQVPDGAFFAGILRDLRAEGPVSFLGNAPLHLYLTIAEEMRRDGWELVTGGDDVIQMARKRKDEREIEAIRSVGERTAQIVDSVRDMLGRPGLRLGDIKHFISLEIARLGMIEDHETIVSQGRDAGIPHSRGDAAAEVRPGVTLVLDIFPADRTTGYFFDMTRTFWGEESAIYRDVQAAYDLAAREMKPGQRAAASQSLVCDFFESKGYKTTRSDPKTLDGYVHSLGHGVGLDIHEKPSFSLSSEDALEAGDVVTIEPGLYFPDREIGVRIEDTFVVREGGVENLLGRR